MITLANNRSGFGRRGTRPGLLIVVSLLVSALCVPAQSDSVELKSSTPSNWNTNPAHWERMLEQHKASSALQIGKSDFTLSGPLVDGVRRRRTTGERSLGKRLLGLPIVRLFVPLPMPSPPGGGRYILWGERDQSWASFSRAPAPLGNTDNPIHREVSGSLISVGLK
jgi:hypothetical protein